MKYNIKLTDEFLKEMDEICDYISTKLKAPDAMKRLREKVIYHILLLEESSRMFAEVNKISKTKRTYRKIVVDNYIVLYTIEDIEKNVYIAHIYYGGKNYIQT